MQPFGLNGYGPKMGLCPFGGGELGPHLTECGQDRGLRYLHTKFHLDPSNRLATIYTNVTDRQTDRTDNDPIA